MNSNLTRLGGLAAAVAGVLFIIADLVALVLNLGQPSIGGLFFKSVVALIAAVLLLLGLVGLYANRTEVMGILGLIGFLVAFFGLTLGQRGFLWAALLANLGWILFGVAILGTRAYPRTAAIILIVGAVLSGIVNLLIGGGVLITPASYAVIGSVADIIFNVAIVWLGFSLFTGRVEETPRITRVER